MPYLVELVWLRLECHSVKNVIEGVYNMVSVVILMMYIKCEMIKYIPWYIMWL